MLQTDHKRLTKALLSQHLKHTTVRTFSCHDLHSSRFAEWYLIGYQKFPSLRNEIPFSPPMFPCVGYY